MYAIKVNNSQWLMDYNRAKDDWVLTFTTEKKAQKEIAWLMKTTSLSNLKAIEVEEDILIDSENGICEQVITEI